MLWFGVRFLFGVIEILFVFGGISIPFFYILLGFSPPILSILDILLPGPYYSHSTEHGWLHAQQNNTYN